MSDSRPSPAEVVRIGLSAAIVLLALVTLTVGKGAATLPIGPAGGLHVAWDPLSASFLLLLPLGRFALLPLAGAGLSLVAADGFVLLVGLLLLGAGLSLRLAAFAAICLIVALALAGGSADFAAVRSAMPEGWRAGGVLFLTLAAAAALSRVNTVVAAYIAIRLLFDLCGSGQPLWWCVPLLLAGAAIALIVSLRAALADTLHDAVWSGSLHQFALATIALGVALCARAVDLPSVASRALDAAWLAVVCHALCAALLLLCAEQVERGAGSRRLDRLGGLIHRMPFTAAATIVGLFAIATLPPGLGFASLWLVIQSLLAAARVGGFGLGLLIASVIAVIGLSAGIAALAAVRLFGTVFLSRTRTPRGAVADEASHRDRLPMYGVTVLIVLLGLLPAIALLPALGWANASASMTPWGLQSGADTAGYAPIVVTVLIAVSGGVILRAARRPGPRRREPEWTGGFAAPPSWLPFGDPATQFGAASFVEPLHRSVAQLPTLETAGRRVRHWCDILLRAVAALVMR